MPTVPLYGDRRVGTDPLPGPRVSPAGDGSGIRAVQQGLDAVGGELARRSMIHRQRADEAWLMDKDNAMATAQLDLEVFVTETRGADAMGIGDEVQRRWGSIVDEHRRSSSSDGQRQAFDRLVSRRWQNLQRFSEGHALREGERYMAETRASGLELARQEALNHYDDEHVLSAAIQKQAVILQQEAEVAGHPPEWLRERTAEAVSGTYADTLLRYLADDRVDEAAANLALVEGQMLADDQDRVRRALAGADQRVQAQAIADEAVAAAGGDSSVDAEQTALEAVRQAHSGAIEDAAVQRVRARFADLRRAQREQLRQLQIAGTNAIIDAPDHTSAVDIADRAPPEIRLELLKLAGSRFQGEQEVAATTKALAAESAIRRRIDEGFYVDPSDVILAASGLPRERQDKLVDYFQAGGAAQGLSDSKVRAALKAVLGNEPNDKQVGRYYERVQQVLPPGQDITYDAIYKAISALAVEGTIEQGGQRAGLVQRSAGRATRALSSGEYFSNEHSLTRLDALELGLDDTFRPTLTEQETRDAARAANESPDVRAARRSEADTRLKTAAEGATYSLGQTSAQGVAAMRLELEDLAAMGRTPPWMSDYLLTARASSYWEAIPLEADERTEYIQYWGTRLLDQVGD